MFRVSQQIDFCYGHRLLNHSGKCGHLHGHNGRAIIVLEQDELDQLGMVVDFSEIKRVVGNWIDENLDHKMLLCEDDPAIPSLSELGEPTYVTPQNPTAENIAKWIFEFSASQGFPVCEVSLVETPDSVATYRG